MEQTANEVTWSSGDRLQADTVAQAFGLKDKADLLQRGSDPGPFVASKGAGCGTVILIAVVIIILLIILSDCSGGSSGGSGYSRNSGGSWGGYSSGGGHK